MGSFKALKKNTKALSPVIASIILMSVAVTVSIISAGWLSRTTLDLMKGAEQAIITNVELTNGSTSAIITIQNSATPGAEGTVSVNITAAYVNGIKVTTTQSLPVKIIPAQSYNLQITLNAPAVSGTQYNVKLTTGQSNSLVFSSFCP
jgi:archaeal type IV pilus assembly protein PilA